MIKLLVLLALIVLSATKSPFDQLMDVISTQSPKNQFKLWHYAMQRSYDLNSEIALKKYKTFKANLKFIDEHNSKQSDYKLGLGPFTDMTWEEFQEENLADLSYLETAKIDQSWMKTKEANFDSLNDENDDDNLFEPLGEYTQGVIESRDWRNLHPIIKSQGSCGSCWSFGTIATFEAQSLINGINIVLSEQEIVDCSRNEYNNGCRGGVIQKAFEYVYNNGVALVSNYPYTGIDHERCKRYETSRAIKSFKYINNCSEFYGLAPGKCKPHIINRYLNDGPVATNIQVTEGLQHYRQGMWLPDFCTRINHTVEIVYLKYNEYSRTGIVTIRNSWGKWGYNGMADIVINTTQGMPGCGAMLHAVGPVGLVY